MRITSMYVMVLFLTTLSNMLTAGESKSQEGGDAACQARGRPAAIFRAIGRSRLSDSSHCQCCLRSCYILMHEISRYHNFHIDPVLLDSIPRSSRVLKTDRRSTARNYRKPVKKTVLSEPVEVILISRKTEEGYHGTSIT